MSQQSSLLTYFDNARVKPEPAQSQTNVASTTTTTSATNNNNDNSTRSTSTTTSTAIADQQRMNSMNMDAIENCSNGEANVELVQSEKRRRTSLTTTTATTTTTTTAVDEKLPSLSTTSTNELSNENENSTRQLSAGAARAIEAERQEVIARNAAQQAKDAERRRRYAFLQTPRDDSGNYKGLLLYSIECVAIANKTKNLCFAPNTRNRISTFVQEIQIMIQQLYLFHNQYFFK
jgi:hypothetical protein